MTIKVHPLQRSIQYKLHCGAIVIMWLTTFLFALRVSGQAIQHWLPQSFLPPFAAFQGSNLPYGFLLSVQLVILVLMLQRSWLATRGKLRLKPRSLTILGWFGGIYLIGSFSRIAIGLLIPTAHPWFVAWISAIFHIVLAAFVLSLYWQQRLIQYDEP